MENEILVRGETLTDSYHEALYQLWEYGRWEDCSDWNTRQKECQMTMTVFFPLEEPRISKFFIGGPKELQQYCMEMLDGILDFEAEKGNWHYTYHKRYADQLDYVINELRRNPSSRRAVMSLWWRIDELSGDPPCFNHCQFLIRMNKLDMIATFRSNDACKAAFMNAFALIMLQKKVADILGVGVGSYTHRANSFHCYEKDVKRLNAFVERYQMEANDELSYSYEDDWKEEMEDAIPEILKAVEILKER